MMRNRFDEQLEQLHVELIKMGALCEEAISSSVKALLEHDEQLRKKTFDIDSQIDQKERDIEGMCLKLLLSQQPVARDLRMISSALKMISDMERIGDQAADIAEITGYINGMGGQHRLPIDEMAQATIKMVTDSVQSFVSQDLELVHAVIAYDDVVDGLFDRVRAQLISLLGADSANGGLYLDLLMIAKYFERIGDHATNIAEWVEFSLTGVHARQTDNKEIKQKKES